MKYNDLAIITVGLQLFDFYFINTWKKGNNFHTSKNSNVSELLYVTCQITRHCVWCPAWKKNPVSTWIELVHLHKVQKNIIDVL